MTSRTRATDTRSPSGSPGGDWPSAREDRLALTYEHAAVGILEIDHAGRILRVNRRVGELMGHAATDLLGRSIFNETSPLDVAQDLVQFRRQVAGEIDRYTIEKRLVRKDGSCAWTEVTSSSVCDATGRFLYAVRVQSDISARRESKAQQGRRRDELADRTGKIMEMLQSLLFVAAEEARGAEARKLLDVTRARVAVMTAVQRVLHGCSDKGLCAAEEFLPAVCEAVGQSLPPDARLACGDARTALASDIAMPLALILNELVINAAGHGVVNDPAKTIRVSLTGQGGALSLRVEDDGERFDAERDLGIVPRTGPSLLMNLMRQLNGTLTLTGQPSCASVQIPAAGFTKDD